MLPVITRMDSFSKGMLLIDPALMDSYRILLKPGYVPNLDQKPMHCVMQMHLDMESGLLQESDTQEDENLKGIPLEATKLAETNMSPSKVLKYSYDHIQAWAAGCKRRTKAT